ncbi:hypothetical protein P691DRAFT_145372 [Macrolepiota fuliginosa MF-IS2]|uniref:Uncharacterized protein n=1 Tax=Macrolepiota fuliginosa MF-IS2 TaxID=1400762 RepID=A0A9P5X9N2_9AGAR|nr:hypothetical protein P691DRAFT_145372 [Macrolepiota fuliginosa MF-IS2]
MFIYLFLPGINNNYLARVPLTTPGSRPAKLTSTLHGNTFPSPFPLGTVPICIKNCACFRPTENTTAFASQSIKGSRRQGHHQKQVPLDPSQLSRNPSSMPFSLTSTPILLDIFISSSIPPQSWFAPSQFPTFHLSLNIPHKKILSHHICQMPSFSSC